MAFRHKIPSGLAAPMVALLGALGVLGWLFRFPGFYADKLVLAALACGLLWVIWSRIRRANLLVARFVSALEHGDLAQSFRMTGQGTGLEELGAAFDGALGRLRSERLVSAADARFASALVDEAPAPLLAVDDAGLVHLANKAARRLFREADGRPAETFARFGADFAHALTSAPPGERRICRILWNGLSQRAVLAVSLFDRQQTQWRIIAVQIIQTELDAAEMATQADLVRVLTHEIMNSLTPVTSLAASASRMLAKVDEGDPDALADARTAVDVLARRAAGIAHFVETYRSFSRAPSVSVRRFAVRPWIDDILQSFRATPQAANVECSVWIGSDALQINGDPDLLGQVMLNLLKNAAQACRSRIELRVETNDADRPVLRVSDDGAGVPAGMEEEIFLPFFTTKSDGTGVGLSFARQIVLLHGGAIGVVPSDLGGAGLQIVLT